MDTKLFMIIKITSFLCYVRLLHVYETSISMKHIIWHHNLIWLANAVASFKPADMYAYTVRGQIQGKRKQVRSL